MKKRIIACILSLAVVLGLFCVPMTASAATIEDVYNYFLTMPMANLYKEDMQKLMTIVPATDAQADQLLSYLQQVNAIAVAAKGNEPRNYTAAEVKKVLDLVQQACAVVNVDVKITPRTEATRISPYDDVILEFFYQGKKIYEYDGDAIRKTGSDISSAALFGSFALLAAAVVTVIVRKKVTA